MIILDTDFASVLAKAEIMGIVKKIEETDKRIIKPEVILAQA